MNVVSRALPAILAIATYIWDAYCQIKGYSYKTPEWVVGIILSPYAGFLYGKTRRALTKTKEEPSPKEN